MCIKYNVHLNHKGTQILETSRYILRKFSIYDVSDIYNNWTSDIESARYNAWKVHSSENVTKEYLKDWIDGYKGNNYYHWAITNKRTEEVIGSISATNIKDRKKYCEIGYTVARKCWNQGVATEVLMKVIEYLTDEIGFTYIRAYHDKENKASGKVMKKAGMLYIKNKKQMFFGGSKLFMDCCIYEYKV